MTKTSLHEAKTNFPELVERALQGEEVVITQNGTPLLKLVPVESPLAPRPVGLDRQEVGEGFLEESLRPLDEDEIGAFHRSQLPRG